MIKQKISNGYRTLKTSLRWSLVLNKLGRRVKLGRAHMCSNPNAVSIGDYTTITENWILQDLCPSSTQSSPKIKIGKWCNIQHDFQCNAYQHVAIGDYCLVAPRVFISDANHLDDCNVAGISLSTKFTHNPVTIGNNCWLGVNVTILSGVTIGNNSIVAAGAVVNKSFPPNSIIAGVPGKRIGENTPQTSSCKDTSQEKKIKNTTACRT